MLWRSCFSWHFWPILSSPGGLKTHPNFWVLIWFEPLNLLKFFFPNQHQIMSEGSRRMEHDFRGYFLCKIQYMQYSRFLLCFFTTVNIKCNIYKTNYDAYYQEWLMFLVNSLFVKFQSLFEWIFSLTRKCICLVIIIEQLCSI
jgi:hypothetical protein